MSKTALVAGATGLVGKHLVNELLGNPLYQKVMVISRRPLSFSHPKLVVKITNFEELESIAFSEKIDECYCALGTTQSKSGKRGLKKVDYDYVLKLAALCLELSIRKFLVVSSQGADAKSFFFYMRTKGLMEEAVKSTGIETIYIMRPSLITGQREESRFGETAGYYLFKVFEPLMVGKLRKMRPVSGLQIAKSMISMAQKEHKGNHTIESTFIQNF